MKQKDGSYNEVTLCKGNRVILEALIARPVYCASPVRLSHYVCNLRSEFGVPITKQMYENDTATDRARFGVYFLEGEVTLLSGDA